MATEQATQDAQAAASNAAAAISAAAACRADLETVKAAHALEIASLKAQLGASGATGTKR